MVRITFESHGTTFDNERHVSSGHNDVALSPLGEQQSQELGVRYINDHFDAIFCSDLQRSYKTAELAFGEKYPIIQDSRLRECNYGDFTQHPSAEVDPLKVMHVTNPFPNGESYEEAASRMGDFLKDLIQNYDNKKVMVIGHRATQYGLEHWIRGVSVKDAVTAPWKWQPGWSYELISL